MKKIIGIIHPFDKYQIFYVYEDGNKLDMIQVKMDQIVDTIFKLVKKYQIYQVDLSGAKFYSKQIIKQVQQREFLEYNKNKITITYI